MDLEFYFLKLWISGTFEQSAKNSNILKLAEYLLARHLEGAVFTLCWKLAYTEFNFDFVLLGDIGNLCNLL